MKKYILTLLIAVIGITAFAQKSKSETVVIQTNGVCETCKKTFTENVPFFKGVTDFKYDVATAKMTVTYNPQKTTVAEIRQGVSKLGYNADDVKADPKAREKLPACCKTEKKSGCSPGCSHGHKH
ncbi:heavy-metal-associated domain-containing protein [Bacteroidales bacterium OttesenSCG-928-B11]|nr:heavy-metal-associated domain-containing protein [Bacteroidales bacterium OttesenSCG-928-E04]MDL2312372.1 heavy-metal-associated domain-containing protein [Bacteroidales bacterium OttesenSCG-928-B11]